jgi:hypothetical protein
VKLLPLLLALREDAFVVTEVVRGASGLLALLVAVTAVPTLEEAVLAFLGE